MTKNITNNLNVVRGWCEGKNARNHRDTLHTRGGALYSYNLKIGERTPTGICVVANFTAPTKNFRSQTTSCHVNLAKPYAHVVMHPLVWETSPLSDEEIPF